MVLYIEDPRALQVVASGNSSRFSLPNRLLQSHPFSVAVFNSNWFPTLHTFLLENSMPWTCLASHPAHARTRTVSPPVAGALHSWRSCASSPRSNAKLLPASTPSCLAVQAHNFESIQQYSWGTYSVPGTLLSTAE